MLLILILALAKFVVLSSSITSENNEIKIFTSYLQNLIGNDSTLAVQRLKLENFTQVDTI